VAGNVKQGAPKRAGATDDVVTAFALGPHGADREPAFLEVMRRQMAALRGKSPTRLPGGVKAATRVG
jgi:hypothetical protein